MAQEVLERAIEEGGLEDVTPSRLMYCCLALSHLEDAMMQENCIQLWNAVKDHFAAESVLGKSFEKHNTTFKKFGRFPERNEALGRASTPEEVAYLEEINRKQSEKDGLKAMQKLEREESKLRLTLVREQTSLSKRSKGSSRSKTSKASKASKVSRAERKASKAAAKAAKAGGVTDAA